MIYIYMPTFIQQIRVSSVTPYIPHKCIVWPWSDIINKSYYLSQAIEIHTIKLNSHIKIELSSRFYLGPTFYLAFTTLTICLQPSRMRSMVVVVATKTLQIQQPKCGPMLYSTLVSDWNARRQVEREKRWSSMLSGT